MSVCEDWGKYELIDLISKDEMPLAMMRLDQLLELVFTVMTDLYSLRKK